MNCLPEQDFRITIFQSKIMSRRLTRSPYEIAFLTACSEIAILDHGQNDILRRLAHVRTWRQQKVTQLTRLMHSNSPISRLPNETLAFIFETITQDAITVSHVNRHWRQLSLQLPSLWRNISGLCSDQIREYLNRSQPLSVAITLNVSNEGLQDDGLADEYFDNEYSNDQGPHEPSGVFMASLTMLIHHVSRWHSFHVSCASPKTMLTILEYLRGLSAPYLTHVSLQLRDEDFDQRSLDWDADIFGGRTPLLHTVHLRGIALSDCYFPSTAIVELKVDTREMSFGFMHPKVFTYMPNLKVLDVRGSFLWSNKDMGDLPVSLPTLERLTWGCLGIKPLLTRPSISVSHVIKSGWLLLGAG